MKTYQISEDRVVVVNKNLVTIKQKDSDKSFEFKPSRLVLRMFVTKYCTGLVCIEQGEFATFHIAFFSFRCMFVCRVGGCVSASP